MNHYAKAVAAAVGAGATAFYSANVDHHITSNEGLCIAVAVISVGVLTWATPNAPAKTSTPPADTNSPMEG